MRLTKAVIDLNALRSNALAVRERVGPDVKIMGIVKANAYGHGMLEIARALVSYGCEYLAVAFLEEGIALRNAGITEPTLVLTGAWPGQAAEFIAHDLIPTITTKVAAEHLNREAERAGRGKLSVHLKVDTGMERQGIRSAGALGFIQDICRLKNLDVAGVYSHLATSEDTVSPFAMEQLDRFHALIGTLERSGISIPVRHIANSGGILKMSGAHESLVRPGIMLYGYSPLDNDPVQQLLRPVLSLTSAVMFVKHVPANTSISYGRTYYTRAATTIATIPVGYGDGYGRILSNRSQVLIRGKRYPVVGTICMDQLMVDVGPDAPVEAGDEVTLIGRDGSEQISAWDLARLAGTIPYEILTGLSERVPRMYIQ